MELNNKQTLRHLRDRIDNALKNIYSHAFEFELGNCTYDGDGSNATFKLNVRVKGAKTQQEKNLDTFAKLDDIDINKTWREGTREFKLCGYNTKARSFPYLMRDINSTSTSRYKIATSRAKMWFGMKCA